MHKNGFDFKNWFESIELMNFSKKFFVNLNMYF